MQKSCMYTTQGDMVCNKNTNIAEGFRPAYISEQERKDAWSERSASGLPYPANEWEIQGKEKSASWIMEQFTAKKSPVPATCPPKFNFSSQGGQGVCLPTHGTSGGTAHPSCQYPKKLINNKTQCQ